MYWVYVIINKEAAKRYIGQTDNLDRRLAEHNGQNKNKHRFTSKYPGKWEILYTETYQTRSKAVIREKHLKSGQGRQWLDQKFGRASQPKAD